MRSTAKRKISLTLSADLVALVDRDAKRTDDTRSGVIEQWLRRAAAASVEQDIEVATAAYYQSLSGVDRVEEVALSKALSAAARRVAYK